MAERTGPREPRQPGGAGADPSAPASQARPASPRALFFACQRLALQGFGGVLPIAQHELVERRGWLSREAFVDLLALAQVLPGPNVVNLVMIYGDRCFGWRGAFAAGAGVIGAPLVVVLFAAALLGEASHWPAVAGALRGMGAVAAGLVIATAWRLAGALGRNPLGKAPCLLLGVAVLLAVGALRWPLLPVLAGLGAAAWLWAWRRLASTEAPTPPTHRQAGG